MHTHTHTLSRDPSHCLAAWRNVFRELNKMTPSQIQAEYAYLSPPPSIAKIADFTTWVAAWENRIADLYKINPQYRIADIQTRNIVVSCVDKDTKSIIDIESAKGNLLGWNDLKDYLTAMGTNRRATEATGKGPTPTIMHAGSEPDTDDKAAYSHDAWNWLLSTQDGVQYVKDHPEEEDAQKHISIMYLKGGFKGNGKSNQKGKDSK